MKELEARLCDQRSRQKKEKEERGNSGGKVCSTAQLKERLPTCVQSSVPHRTGCGYAHL